MPRFTYQARDRSGKPAQATVAASSRRELVASLSEQDLFVIAVQQHDPPRSPARPWLGFGLRPGLDETALVWREMSVLLAAGISVPESLATVRDQARNRLLRTALTHALEMIFEGHSLSAALAHHSRVFPGIVRDLVRTGESSGDLAAACGHLATYLEQALATSRRIKGALLYPAVVLTASLVTVLVLVTFILPRFATLFRSLHVDLPTPTRLLLAASDWMSRGWYLGLVALPVLVLLVRAVAGGPRARALTDHVRLRLPVVGDIVRKVLLSRIASTLATGLSAGVPVLEILEIAAECAGSPVYTRQLRRLRDDVSAGDGLAKGLGAKRAFPPLFVQMVAAGERTGELPEMLQRAAAHYHDEADAKMRSLTTILEPALVVVMGVIVGFIAIAVVSPIYTLVERIGQ